MTIQEKVKRANVLQNQIEVLTERVKILKEGLEGTKTLSLTIYGNRDALFSVHACGGQVNKKQDPNGGENDFNMPYHYLKFLRDELEYRTHELNYLTEELEELFK